MSKKDFNLKQTILLILVGFNLAAVQLPQFHSVHAQDQPSQAQQTLTDDEIRELLIRQSIARYPGPCACPYNVMRNGRACGRRSAYSRPGGYVPLCYPRDVSDSDVQKYKRLIR